VTDPGLTDGRWTTAELAKLPTENGIRLRGTDATRLDTFVDAAFAFAVTLLVISVDEVPSSYDEFMQALGQIPAFLACFALMMLFWWGHHNWSRKFGLHETPSTLLSLALVALVLIYVYPLRLISGAFFSNASGGALPSGLNLTLEQLTDMFIVFGIGFSTMSGALVALYLRVDACRDQLQLNARERYFARSEAATWGVLTATGLISTLMALLLPSRLGPAAGFVYWSLIISMPIQSYFAKRGRRRFDIGPPGEAS
jgi:uncharacterized membrane protein